MSDFDWKAFERATEAAFLGAYPGPAPERALTFGEVGPGPATIMVERVAAMLRALPPPPPVPPAIYVVPEQWLPNGGVEVFGLGYILPQSQVQELLANATMAEEVGLGRIRIYDHMLRCALEPKRARRRSKGWRRHVRRMKAAGTWRAR
jgi:hypothetical protein